jgi:hypothetical protein
MKIKTIDINAKEWFDKVNGNSYFAGTVTVNYGLKDCKSYIMPFQYGYGSQYTQEAFNLLKKELKLNVPNYDPLSIWCRMNDIILRTHLQENCLKRELMSI